MCATSCWVPEMRRRGFVGACLGAALTSAAPGPSFESRSPASALADAAHREPFLKSLRDFLPLMKELECSRLILQTGNRVAGLSPEQMRANCIETLRRGGEIAAQNNIELLIENIDPEENPKYFLTSSAEGFEIVRAVANPHV